MWWGDYSSPGFWDELLDGGRRPRPGAEHVLARLAELGPSLVERQRAAEAVIRTMGITFSVYSEGANVDRFLGEHDVFLGARGTAREIGRSGCC